jgi:hypothetical protein
MTLAASASKLEVAAESDCLEVSGPGPWIHYVGIEVGTYVLPTVKIELRLATELRRNREDRYGPILTGWLSTAAIASF